MMRVGIGEAPPPPNGYIRVRTSELNAYGMCQQRWHNERVGKRVSALPEASYLTAGKVGHAAVADLHKMMGDWTPEAASGIAHTYAEQLRNETAGNPLISDGEREKLNWFATWLEDVLPLYAAMVQRPDWDEMLLVEQPIWLEISPNEAGALAPAISNMFFGGGYARLECQGVQFVATPDSLRSKRGSVCHYQIKFLSKSRDIPAYLAQQELSRHEALYLFIAQKLCEQGLLPKDLRVGHSVFHVFRKLERPEPPETMTPPRVCGCTKLDEMSAIEYHAINTFTDEPRKRGKLDVESLAFQGVCDKIRSHQAEENARLNDFARAVERRRDDSQLWFSRALDISEVVMSDDQRNRLVAESTYMALEMAATAAGARLPHKHDTLGCSAFYRTCPYLPVCQGRIGLDSEAYVDREPDYADVLDPEVR